MLACYTIEHRKEVKNMNATNLKEMVCYVPKEGKNMCSIVDGKEVVNPTDFIKVLGKIGDVCEPLELANNNVSNNIQDEISMHNVVLTSDLVKPKIYGVAEEPKSINSYYSNNVAAKIKEFDAEQKTPMLNDKGIVKFNSAFSALVNPKKVSQHDIMQEFIKLVPVITQQGKVFLYNNIFYEMSKPDSVKQKILEFFRDELKDKPSSYVNGIYGYLKIEPTIAVKDDAIRRDLLTFNNVVLNLVNGEIYDLSPRFVTTYQIRANYLPNYNTPTYIFDKFIGRITGNDPLLAQRILEIIGYCLTPDTSAKVLFLFQGLGDTGKSILARLMQMLFTPEVVYPMKAENLRRPFSMGELYNRAFCVCNDMPAECLDDKTTGTLKELTGRDLISSAVKYAEDIVFTNFSKILIVTNHALKTKTPDEAFLRRVVCVPFKYPVPLEEIDVNLLDKLWLERDGIVTAAITAYWQLKNRNYIFSGNYEPNVVVVHNPGTEIDNKTVIAKYLIDVFEADAESIVFIEDAYNEFSKINPKISMNVFSSYFKCLAYEIFGADEGRKRRCSAANAQSCVKGIKFKEI